MLSAVLATIGVVAITVVTFARLVFPVRRAALRPFVGPSLRRPAPRRRPF